MKPFNLEEAKAGRPVCTRDGKDARIICFDLKNVNPILAIVTLDNGSEKCYSYYSDGSHLYHNCNHLDLMMKSEKKIGWINIYNIFGSRCNGSIYNSEKEALDNKNPSASYIATIKIEWEE